MKVHRDVVRSAVVIAFSLSLGGAFAYAQSDKPCATVAECRQNILIATNGWAECEDKLRECGCGSKLDKPIVSGAGGFFEWKPADVRALQQLLKRSAQSVDPAKLSASTKDVLEGRADVTTQAGVAAQIGALREIAGHVETVPQINKNVLPAKELRRAPVQQ